MGSQGAKSISKSWNTMQTLISQTVITDANGWVWGFSPQAELWNGRFAMIGFVSAILVEVLTNRGVLHFWGNQLFEILSTNVLVKILEIRRGIYLSLKTQNHPKALNHRNHI
jgi:hypothetical protein